MTGSSPYRPPLVYPGGPSHNTSEMSRGRSASLISYQQNPPKSLRGAYTGRTFRRLNFSTMAQVLAYQSSRVQARKVLSWCLAMSAPVTRVESPEPHSKMDPVAVRAPSTIPRRYSTSAMWRRDFPNPMRATRKARPTGQPAAIVESFLGPVSARPAAASRAPAWRVLLRQGAC